MARRKVEAANPTPCAACPWRTTNHGKPHPDGWYTARNRDRLWAKLRRGDSMTCHPTDPENPVPDGGKAVPEGATTHECAGGLILQQREAEKCSALFGSVKEYARSCKRGLTFSGLVAIAERALFGGTPLGGVEMTRTNMNDPVSHPPLGVWDPQAVLAGRAAKKKS